ncbi:hypothetical protein L2712_18840 [Shewanella marisflavi]|uniref:hypothetical protein n=1 Tax=Shewanella marisflavi TaxID=260364 RepID=UPI00200C18C4|nr:hypothetical protein [Shewanella marisflavi]MCL1043688.1 hypothetical protein [Shewanella marisflavi]
MPVANFIYPMYTFENYLKLSRRTKSLATRYWCACLKAHLGESTAYGMKRALFADSEQCSSTANWLNNSSRFFNKKEQGEPVIREYVVDIIDRRLNSPIPFKSLLCHPLWQLIDNRNPTISSVNVALSNLPSHYVNLLFTEDSFGNLTRKQSLTKKAVWSLIQKTDIHAFTCLIGRCLQETTMEGERLDTNQLEAVKYLLKLANITPFKSIATDFYRFINDQFWHLYLNTPLNVHHVIWPIISPKGEKCYLPMRLIAEEALKIDEVIELYETLYEQACTIGLVPGNPAGEADFYAFICHTEMQPLIDTLFNHTPPPKTLTDLKHRIFLATC